VANIGAVGSDAQFGFAEETVWASGSPTIDNFIPFLSESLQLERNIVMSDAIRGATARSIWREGAERAGGDLNVEVQPVGMYTLFKHALGRSATAGPSGSGFYVHDFYPSGTLPEGLRLEIGRTGVSGGTFEYRGCKVNQLTLNCTVGEPLTAVFSFLGKDEITHAANPTSASSISALNPLTFDEGEMLIDANSQEVAGFSLNIANNLVEDKGALGDRYRVAIPRTGFRDVTGTLNLEFDNLDMYYRYTGGTETKLKLTFTSDDMAAGTQAHALIIDCPRIVFTGTTPVVGGPDLIYYDMPFVALFDDDEGNPDYKNEVRIRAITSDASV
jgi:hypothetical protein